ncbi:glycoside hydrolase domain-containing protein, partial [Streptomyces sp. NBC_00102]|uniref:glycoside hydrolase domain-containing protein n=1 Tax=Streptomyces sp. NBC_00102 TaxID=2975652 RepID=UPI00224FB4F4
SGEYAIGSPLFKKATVHLENGRTLTVKAPKNSSKNIYIQGLKVNGKKWTSTTLPSDLLSKGGVLDFDMGSKPSSWGTGKNAAPVSLTKDDKVPAPKQDVLKGDGALFDDTSATSAEAATVELPVTGATKAAQYTLTSAKAGAAPAGWVLQGSSDGKTWKDLDKRSGQTFAYTQQTRVFSVARPGDYQHYRLVLDGTSTLSEIELIS